MSRPPLLVVGEPLQADAIELHRFDLAGLDGTNAVVRYREAELLVPHVEALQKDAADRRSDLFPLGLGKRGQSQLDDAGAHVADLVPVDLFAGPGDPVVELSPAREPHSGQVHAAAAAFGEADDGIPAPPEAVSAFVARARKLVVGSPTRQLAGIQALAFQGVVDVGEHAVVRELASQHVCDLQHEVPVDATVDAREDERGLRLEESFLALADAGAPDLLEALTAQGDRVGDRRALGRKQIGGPGAERRGRGQHLGREEAGDQGILGRLPALGSGFARC